MSYIPTTNEQYDVQNFRMNIKSLILFTIDII